MPDCGTICPGLCDTVNLPAVDAYSWNAGKISCLVYEVKRGTKPCAEITVSATLLPRLTADLESAEVNYHIVPNGEDCARVYLYKHPHMLIVLKHLTGEVENEHIFRVWAWGKVFGYSEEAIAEFIESEPA